MGWNATPLAFLGLAAVMLGAPSAAHTQPVRRIAILCATSCSNLPSTVESWDRAFVQKLEEHGYRLGRDVDLDLRGVGVGVEGLARAAARLVDRRVDIIVTVGTSPARAAHDATTSIPIVMINASDPVEEGLIVSLARPGANITGLAVPTEQLVVKQIELLAQLAPSMRRIAVLSNPISERQRQRIVRLDTAVRALGIQPYPVGVASSHDIDAAFALINRERAEAVVVTDQVAETLARGEIVQRAIVQRLPTVGTDNYFAIGGGLASYGPAVEDQYARAAVYVARILKGAKPAALPVEEPSRYELIVNLTTARAIGVTIPQSVLIQADKVLQ